MEYVKVRCSSCGKEWHIDYFGLSRYVYKQMDGRRQIMQCSWSCFNKERKRCEEKYGVRENDRKRCR